MKVHAHYFILSFLVLTLLLSTCSGSKISHYDVYGVRTGKLIGKVTENEELVVNEAISIVAVVTVEKMVKTVTFTSPFNRAEYGIPFSLGGSLANGKLHPVDMDMGLQTISAYINKNKRNQLTVRF